MLNVCKESNTTPTSINKKGNSQLPRVMNTTYTSPKKETTKSVIDKSCFPQTQKMTSQFFMGYTGSKHRYYTNGQGKFAKRKLVLPSQVN